MVKLWTYAVSTGKEQDDLQENPNPDKESKDKTNIPAANNQNKKSNFLAVKEASDEKSVDEEADGKEANDVMDMSGGDESSEEKVDPETYAKMMSQLSDSTMLDEGENGDDTGDLLQDDYSDEEDGNGLQQQKAGGVKRKAQEIAQPNPKKQLTNNMKAKPVVTN
jgi:hypothetical protein